MTNRHLLALCVVLALGGCGLAQQARQQEEMRAAEAVREEGMRRMWEGVFRGDPGATAAAQLLWAPGAVQAPAMQAPGLQYHLYSIGDQTTACFELGPQVTDCF